MKKRLFTVALCLFISVFLLNAIPFAVSAAVLGDDYPEKYKNPAQDTVVDDYSFWNRECTSFVAWRLNHTNGISFTNYYVNGVRVHNDIDKVSGDYGNGNGTKMGHAKYWGTAFQSMGYTVDSTPAVGAILWSSSGTYGHVAWVAEVNGTNVTVEEYNNWYGAKEYTGVGQNGVYDRITKTNAEFLNSGYRYIHVNSISNDSQAATLSLEKQNFLTNEHVTFYYNAPASHTHCNVKIFKDNQLSEIISTSNGFDTRYYSEPGTYSAYFEVVNNNSVVDTSNTIYFTVQQEYTKPSNVQLALEKNIFNVGEHTTFYPDGNYVLYYFVTVYKDGNVYESVKIDPYHYYTNSYTEVGNYSAYAEAHNVSGIVYSNNVEFVVKSPMPSIHGTLQKEQNNLKITVSTNNVNNGILIIAGYNNDKLISFQLEDNIQENSTYTLSPNIDKVKLMVWSDLKSMNPVCTPETIVIKE